MKACLLLLGRPWQFDRKAQYDGRAKTYSFRFDRYNIRQAHSNKRAESRTPKRGQCNGVESQCSSVWWSDHKFRVVRLREGHQWDNPSEDATWWRPLFCSVQYTSTYSRQEATNWHILVRTSLQILQLFFVTLDGDETLLRPPVSSSLKEDNA